MEGSQFNRVVNFIPDKFEKFSLDQKNFLFCVKPKTLDKQTIGGFTLKTGVRVFSVFIFLEALNTLVDLFSADTFWKFICYLLVFIFFLMVGFYVLYSTIKDKLSFARIGYFGISVIFIVQVIHYVAQSILKIIDFITPWDGDFLKLRFLVYIFGEGLFLFIYLYFIWVLFCFMKTLEDSSSSQVDESDKQNV